MAMNWNDPLLMDAMSVRVEDIFGAAARVAFAERGVYGAAILGRDEDGWRVTTEGSRAPDGCYHGIARRIVGVLAAAGIDAASGGNWNPHPVARYNHPDPASISADRWMATMV